MASVPTRKKPIDEENYAMDCQANVMDYPATQAFTCSDDEEQESSDPDEKTVIQIGKIIVDSVSYPIYRGINKVGRLSSCGVVINDSTVSKEHAEIEADTGSKSTFVCDLGSMNKTRLNNILLRPRKMYQLNYGDTIRFGSVVTTYSKIAENTAGDSAPSEQSHQKHDDFVVPETPARWSKDAASTICVPSSPDISFTSDRSSAGSCSDVSLVMGTQQPVPSSHRSDVVSVEKYSDTKRNLNLGNNSTINGSYDHSILDAEDQNNQSDNEDDIFDAETQRNDIFLAETQQLTIQDTDSKKANSHKELHRYNVPENPTQQTSIYEAETQQIKMNEQNVDRSFVDKDRMDSANIYEQATQITNIHEVETQPINIAEDDVIPPQKKRSAINENCLEFEEISRVSSPAVARMRSMSNDRSNSSPTNTTANRNQTSKLENGTKDEDSETDEEGLFAENHWPKNSDEQVLHKSADEMYDAPTQLIGVSSEQGASVQKNLKLNEITPSDGNTLRDGFEKVANDKSARQKSTPASGKRVNSSLINKTASQRTIINESLDDDETDFEDEGDSLLNVAEATTTPKLPSNDELVKTKNIASDDSVTKYPCTSSDSGTEDATTTMKPHDSIEEKLNDLFEEAKNDSFVEEPTQLLTQTLHKVLESTQVLEEDGAASPKTDSKISGDLNCENTVSSLRLTPTNVATVSSNGLEVKNENTTSDAKNLDCASNNNVEASPRKNEFVQAKPSMSSSILDTEDLFADLPEVTILSATKKPLSSKQSKKRGKPTDRTTTPTIHKDSDSDSENDEDVVKTVTSKRKTVSNKRKTKKPDPVATPKIVPQEPNILQDQGEETVQKRFSGRIMKAKTTLDLPTASSTVPIVPPVVIPADDIKLENIPEPRMSLKKNRKANVTVEKNQATIMPLQKMMKVNVLAEKMSAIDKPSIQNRATTTPEEQDSSATIPTESSASENIPPEKTSAESVSGEKIPVAKTRAKKTQSANISSDKTPDTNTLVKRVSTRSKRLITSYATLNKDQILVENQIARMRSEQISPALVVIQRIGNVPSMSETSNKPPNTDSESKATGKNRGSVFVAKAVKDLKAVEDVEAKTAIPETKKAPECHVTIRTTRRKIDKVTVRRSPSSPMVRINYDKPASPVPVATTPETPKSGKTLSIGEPKSSERKSVKRGPVSGSGTDTVNKVAAKRKKVSESVEALETPKASKHEETQTVKTSYASCSSPVAIISLRKVDGSSSLWTTNTKTAKAKAGKKQGRQTLKNSITENTDTVTTRDKPQSRSLRSSLLSTTTLQQVDGQQSLESQEIETILTNSSSGSDKIGAVNTGNRILSRRIPCQRLDDIKDSTDEGEEGNDDAMASNSRPTNKTKINSDSVKTPSKRRKITRATPNVIRPTHPSPMSSKTPKENDSVVAAKITKATQSLPSSAKSITSKSSMKYQVLFTGVSDERLTSAVRDLGGSVTEKSNECTVLVTDKVRRTFKFLCAMASAVPIVSADWLFDSQKQKQFLPTEQYLLDDPAEEKKYKFNLRKSLDSANQRRLLEGWTVVLAPNTTPPPLPEMKGIIQACGGKPIVRAPATWPAKVVVIAREEDPSSWKKIMKTAPVRVPLVSREFILTGILRQELNFDEHRLHVR